MAFCGAAIDTPTRSFLVVSPASQPSASSVCCLPAPLSLPHSSRCAGGIAAAAVAWCGLFSAAGCRLRGPPWRQKPPAGIAVSACVSVRRRTTTEQTSRRQREREGSTSAQPAGPGDASPARRLASLARTNGMEQRERAKEGQCPSAGGCWCVMLSGAWHTCRDNSSCRANAGETRSSKHSTLWTMR